MSVERELTLNDYISIVKRRFNYILGLFCILFPLVVVYAIAKSPTYESKATIQIESPQITSQEAKESFATERFAKLNQLVLSKENLLKIAKKYKLYGLDKKSDIPSESLYFSTRGNIFIEKLRAEAEGWQGSPTFAFNISFQHYDAKETYSVTNDLVDLFLSENDKYTKGRVVETEAFFSKEEERRRLALEDVENKLATFKRQNADSLPENKQIYVASLERLEKDLRANQLEYRATKAELRSLDVSLESAKAGNVGNGSIGLASGSSELQNLKLELAKQKSIYSDNHPSVRSLQRRIDALISSSEGQLEKSNNLSPSQSIMVAKVQAQIETANDRLDSLKAEESSIRAKMSHTENSLMRSSQTESDISALLREYDNAKASYNDIKAKLEASKIAKSIEVENKGEHFVLIEAPVLPDKPIKPNRIKIIVGGFFGSILASIVLPVVMDLMGKGVRGVSAIASITQMQPLAAIPYIKSRAEDERNKQRLRYLIMCIIGLLLMLLLIIHFFVMPLDLLASKVASRF